MKLLRRALCGGFLGGRFGMASAFISAGSPQASSPSQALTRQTPPFVTCGDIFPRPGEVFPQRESLWRNHKLCGLTGNFSAMPRPLPLGEVDLRSKDGEGEAADRISSHKKGCCMKRCAAALLEAPPLRMPTQSSGSVFSVYALRPARPLPALFSLRTKSFWCLRWLGVGWESLASPARLPVWATSGSMRSSVHS